MILSELIAELGRLKSEHGDIPVVCAPFSYKPEAHEARVKQKRCWWCKQRIGSAVMLLDVGGVRVKHPYNVNEMTREPEPAAWGMPGMGSVRASGNPAREVTL